MHFKNAEHGFNYEKFVWKLQSDYTFVIIYRYISIKR